MNVGELTRIGASNRTRYRLIRGLIKKYNLTKGKVLDVGCGDGTLLNSLNKYFPDLDVWGIDTGDYIEQPNIAQGDITKHLMLGHFDLILCSEVLEHIEEWKTAIKNIAGHMKPGGHVIITSPYSMKYWTRHDEYAGHVRRWEEGVLEAELTKNKVEVVGSWTWGRFVYKAYYAWFLKRQSPERFAESKPGLLRKLACHLAYFAFRIDDLWSSQGRILFIVGKKVCNGS